MITEIGSSKTFNFKIFAIPVFLIIFLFSIYLIIHPGPNDKSIVPVLCAYAFAATIAASILGFLLQVIYIPNGIIIDDELKQLTLKYLVTKQKTIPLNNISAYKKIHIRTKRGVNYGVVIYLKNRPVLLSDFNLNGYLPVKGLLANLNVSNIAEERFSFNLYFMHQLNGAGM